MRFSEDRIEKLTCSDGIRRDIHIWEHEKPLAVFLTVHGLQDHGGNYLNVGMYLKKRGYALVAYDQHGHDRKSKAYVPRFDVFLNDLELMFAWVKEHYRGTPVFIMGHSMGGLIVTHYGIRKFHDDPIVKGFILSAPGYRNSLKVSRLVIMMGRLLSRIAPRMAVPLEDLRMHVTHDKTEYERMRSDERDGIQATKLSARLGDEFLKAQDWVPAHIGEWKHHTLAIIPGNDKLADSQFTRHLFSRIEKGLLTVHEYPENYHECFNEVNREEVLDRMMLWCEARLR